MNRLVAGTRAAALAIGFAMATNTALAQNCDVFTDVLASDGICPSVQWLKNRGITTGCTATAYCPTDPVSRAQMALFMNRLGKAITPRLVSLQLGTGTGSNLGPGTFIPVCQTSGTALPPVNYPQQVRARGTVSAPFGAGTVAIALYLSLNNQAFTSMNSTEMQISTSGGDELLHWSSNVMPVAPGNAVSVAIGIVNRGAGVLSLQTNGRCAIEVEAINDNPTSPPFDE